MHVTCVFWGRSGSGPGLLVNTGDLASVGGQISDLV
jgi:hypothetical protein